MFAEEIWQPWGMEKHIELLARRVRERRAELGLSQEEVAARGGPSTTTLTKIEAGQFKTLRQRTLTDLDHALGWRVDSAGMLLYVGDEPKVVGAPRTPRSAGGGPVVDPPLMPADASEREWFFAQGATDSDGSHVVVGAIASTDAEGVRPVVEVRYWPGNDSRLVSMAAFPGVVAGAYHAALEATNIYREPKEPTDAQRDTAPSTQAGGSPADDEKAGYELAAMDTNPDAEVETWEEQP